ncbi:MAG: hypothetical protein ACKOLZ_00840, partial [Verrucomicrobiota bacterium]
MRLACLTLLLPFAAFADTVTLKDGTFLRGRIERIVDGRLEVTVPLLGEAVQRIALASVESFQ